MSTYTQIYCHLLFATKEHQPVLEPDELGSLFRYINGIIRKRDCRLNEINGVRDHVHLLVHLHPSFRLADLVKEIKIGSGNWIRKNKVFPKFDRWQDGYAAFTVSPKDRTAVENYIQNQPRHHQQVSFIEELRSFLMEYGIEFDDKFLI